MWRPVVLNERQEIILVPAGSGRVWCSAGWCQLHCGLENSYWWGATYSSTTQTQHIKRFVWRVLCNYCPNAVRMGSSNVSCDTKSCACTSIILLEGIRSLSVEYSYVSEKHNAYSEYIASRYIRKLLSTNQIARRHIPQERGFFYIFAAQVLYNTQLTTKLTNSM